MNKKNDSIEMLADWSHNQWSKWMIYLFDKCVFNDDGTATIPASLVQRWQRQINTPYSHLPPDEQDSDKRQAKSLIKYIDMMVGILL